jgi:hypothetical protein
LSKWHPLLSDYYSSKDENVSDLEHEKKWEYAAELRNTLNETRLILIDWANILEEVAEVPSLIG